MKNVKVLKSLAIHFGVVALSQKQVKGRMHCLEKTGDTYQGNDVFKIIAPIYLKEKESFAIKAIPKSITTFLKSLDEENEAGLEEGAVETKPKVAQKSKSKK